MLDPNGSVLTAVAGAGTAHIKCWASVIAMERREQDCPTPLFGWGTKGYEVRQRAINTFLDSDFEWLLMLDGDMVFESDTLEKLRAHEKSYVSGYYVHRNVERPVPIWYQFPDDPTLLDPIPFFDVPESGRLHPLGGSGWGCVLLHRSVIEDTRPLLYGEWEVLEDDMDVWPYDAAEINGLIDTALIQVAYQDTRLDDTLNCLAEKFRPLRPAGKREPMGSDIRFPFFARQAGHILYGDPDVRPGHMVNFPMTAAQYTEMPDDERERFIALLMAENGHMQEEAVQP